MPKSPSATNAGATATNATINGRQSHRPQNRRRAITQPRNTPDTSDAIETTTAKIKLLRAQVQAKSSRIQSAIGKRCGEIRVAPVGPRSTKMATGSATAGASTTAPTTTLAIERSQRNKRIRLSTPSRSGVLTREQTPRHRTRIPLFRADRVANGRSEGKSVGSIKLRGSGILRERQSGPAGDYRVTERLRSEFPPVRRRAGFAGRRSWKSAGRRGR
jgi:hypothetical protein